MAPYSYSFFIMDMKKSTGKQNPRIAPKKQSDSSKSKREQLNESKKGTRSPGPRSNQK